MATTEMIVLVPPSPPPTPLPPEASLSTQERLRLAKRRRAAQLKRWAQRERERTHPDVVQMDGGGMATSSGKGRGIRFISNVMLLEAAARNDVEEGEKEELLFGVKECQVSMVFLFQCEDCWSWE